MLKKTTRGMTAGMTRRGVGFAVAGGGAGYDTDAQAYITLVESEDGQSLETGVKDAINAFVVGCKSDGIWDAIKASCIMAGARTLDGALVPLVGTAPTPYNFVSGDYSRTTGLVGDNSTKYLDSNRNNTADPQNSKHLYCYISKDPTATVNGFMGTFPTAFVSGGSFLYRGSTSTGSLRANNASTQTYSNAFPLSPGGFGISRTSSSAYTTLAALGIQSGTISSASPINFNIAVFQTGLGFTDARLSFYSIGEALDLADLDSRVTTLMSQLTFAINTGLSPIGYSTETIAYINAGYAAGGTLA